MDHENANQNHLKLSRFHFGLAVAYFFVLGIFLYYSWPDLTPSGKVGLPIVCCFPVTVHALLALGSKVKSELSRKVSVLVGVSMLVGFPIGTILGFFFLPLTQWKATEGTPSENS